MKLLKSLIVTSVITISLLIANTVQAAPSNVDAKIQAKMLKLGLVASKIEDAPVKGLKQIYTNRGVFYMSEDTQFFIAGRLFDTDDNMTNLTETALSSLRIDGMKEFKDSMIVFPAKNEKAQITVFTDTTCGYCRKLHAQIDDYNDLGITVNYLAFPRGGLNSRSFEDISAVWCSKDQKQAMTDAKAGSKVAKALCSAPIAGHYNLGQAAGVTGTPAIMFEDGTMIPGYKPPSELAQILELN
ncbi:bifunctional protein-disulfide isomerase/oxidoreductase DsbC [Psychrosphaera sp. B3R10]|uniref:bifunctional protein-disulfide isomerase/oxidoreductase DsbC n=1 Tax=unclassified Psychrosphaera TaxID=2641570 RepID=UPI001C080CC5|nr:MULTISPECIES: bifunctional protein-disulfide isomerase/oxidoreductase DsbC [unclassified Psychrosphaera]MBU2881438.1 bifunctional protein-disulfide isomerase/oxidoreductase DsbC [Psychrosphaera sp. I2R16]MBU2989550.1 bifunctional protein-disulfide isomerase/oxidoreductase DsbC [Psychrosphaera sp. B3R10]